MQTTSHKKQMRCAYHPNQKITKFCKCSECLLPVCQVCIKLHTEDHRLNQTSPNFSEIHLILEDIQKMYEQMGSQISALKEQLISTEKKRKQSEDSILKSLIQNRNHLIKEFERSLLDLEESFIQNLQKNDEVFVHSLEKVDDKLTTLQKNIEAESLKLNNEEECLKSLIVFFGKDLTNCYSERLNSIREEVERISKQNIKVLTDETELSKLQKILQKYIRLEINH